VISMVFDLFTYGFMQRALITGVAIAIICSMVGIFLVLRRYSLFGDALSHMAFGGIAIGLFLNVYPLWTAFAVSVLSALGITKLRKSTKISGDAAIAVLLSSGLAIGVLLVSASKGFTVDLFSFLFGSILLTSMEDTFLILGISGGVVATVIALRKELLYVTFDEEQATVSGLSVNRLNYVFMILASVTVITSMRLVGILLISALIVLPNIASMMMGKGFKKTVIISISLSVGAVVGGTIASYYLDLAPSGTIVMILVGMFLGTLLAKSTGLFSKKELVQENTISYQM
jgi:zinc transport system permease protein